jgi:hypothetical protein
MIKIFNHQFDFLKPPCHTIAICQKYIKESAGIAKKPTGG